MAAEGSLLRYRAGTGPSVVLLPGLGADWQVWEPVIPELVRRTEVFALDLPGLGRPPRAASGSTIQALTDDVAAELTRLRLERPLIVGNSLGGWIALELARRQAAGAVVAVSPAGLVHGLERWYAAQSLWMTRRAAKLVRTAAPGLARSAVFRTAFFAQTRARPWQVPPRGAAAELDVMAGSPLMDDILRSAVLGQSASGLDEIRCPVLIVWGARDRLLPAYQARRFIARIPGSRLVVLPGAGHVPMADRPGSFARVVLRFLDKTLEIGDDRSVPGVS